ncbi:Rec8 like protein-domain-containing protein [Circinella umbellata]|nr:Rec8 like protein-domain-containing protein [Circinella umbellata]
MTELLIGGTGPLARVWLASHWERKISKSQFLQTNLEKTIDAITTNDHEPLTLRMSGQLLLGVVRIYSRKTRYLLEDCNEALGKIKLSFKKGNVNMPDIQHTVASIKSITLPEKLTEFDILLPNESLFDLEIDAIDAVLDSSSQIASSQDITLSDIQDISFGFDWDINADGAMTEQGRRHLNNDDEDQNGQVDQLDIGSVEMGRRDNEMPFDREPSFTEDINGPLSKMNLQEQQPDDYVDFDDFDFGDEGGVFAQTNNDEDLQQRRREEDEQFHRLDDSEFNDASSLMHSGLVPDDDDSQVMMFDTENMDTAEPTQPRRRRRRLVMDRVTEIPHEQLRTNISNTSSLINRNANILQNKGKTNARSDWKRPIAISNNTKIGQLYSRLNTKTTIQDNEIDMGRMQSPELINNEQQGEGGLTYQQADDYMDFDDYDFGDTAPVVQNENNELTTAARTDYENDDSINTQNTQSTMSKSTHETLEKIQSRIIDNNTQLTFGELAPTHQSNKSEAARHFYDVLLLTTKDLIKVQQQEAFGEIRITA